MSLVCGYDTGIIVYNGTPVLAVKYKLEYSTIMHKNEHQSEY